MGIIGPVGSIGKQGEAGGDGQHYYFLIIKSILFIIALGRCNCSLPDLYVQRIPVPGPPMPIDKLVPVPVVVVKEVEVTKLVPFEPTPPGFAV